jgi:hypothetical protein
LTPRAAGQHGVHARHAYHRDQYRYRLRHGAHLAKHGHTVVATMRNLGKPGPLEATAREQGVRLAVREWT